MKTITTHKYIILTSALTLLSTALLAAGVHEAGQHEVSNKKNMLEKAHWMSPKEAMMIPNPIQADANSIAKGSALFQQNCASCHGKTAEGDGPSAAFLPTKPSNLKAMAGGHPDGDFAWKIANGRGAMPGWKGILSQKDIWNTVNYVQSLKSKETLPAKTEKKHDADNHKHQ